MILTSTNCTAENYKDSGIQNGERDINSLLKLKNMKVINVEVPDWVTPEEAKLWIAEGLGRKISRRIILEALAEDIPLDEKSFENTREEVWSEIKRKYLEMGLI
ncbi:hypothetical protein A3L14_05435 [Thermococcus thioreducens]|nr:hypothetical protein A3L14_05435 [Thermococcus thioreducens]